LPINLQGCTNIGKVYLLATEINNGGNYDLNDYDIYLNNIQINFNSQSRINSQKTIFNDGWLITHLKEVNLENIINDQITINLPSQDIVKYYSGFYLVIECLNNSYEETSYNIIINSNLFNTNIELSNSNPVEINPSNQTQDVGFSIVGLIMNFMNGDSNVIKFNNNYIGNIAGEDLSSFGNQSSGVRGHFEYKNGELFGLDDDTPDNIMNGTDALAKVNEYMPTNNSFYFSSLHEDPLNNTNITQAAILVYTSNCTSFPYTHSPDTTICPNTTVPLFASGGSPNTSNTGYQWLADGSVAKAAEVLSCTTCPNPVFSGSKNTLLTVQIWNNDSCSVVRPIKVNVRQKPAFTKFEITPSDCGTNNGKVSFLANQFINFSSIDNQAFTDALQYENLSAGQHHLQIEDAFTCKNDSLFLLPEQNLTNASYSPSPGFGYMPLEVAFLQQSSHATEYDWYINQMFFDELTSFTFDSSGVYTVELIAWQYDPSCADSFKLTILVYDNFSVSVPNIFTPNNDGINDFFGITVSNEVEITYTIFNRWGNLITQGTETGKGFVKLWEGENVKDGTYFYQISVSLKEKLLLPSEPNPNLVDESDFPMKLDGWVQVVR
jgi:gliding motility-associated-like protein